MKTIIILGSSRSNGDTRKLADFLVSKCDYDFEDLNEHKIGYYDYSNTNSGDGFIPLMEKILAYDHIIFATPIYWYTMSAQMKTFFDRFTDIMTIRKDIGKSLNGKHVSMISCSGSPCFNEELPKPIERTANYFKMHFEKHVHGRLENGKIPEDVKSQLLKLKIN